MEINYAIMKRLLLIALFLLCANAAFGQDIIRTNDGSEIIASIQEIGEETIVYKLWTDLEGPLFRIDKAKVVKVTLQSGAEYYYSDLYKKLEAGEYVPKSIDYHGGALYNSVSNLKLTKDEIKSLLTEDQYNKYLSSQKLKNTKNALLFSGLGCMAIGGACYYFALHNDNPGFLIGFFACGITGTTLVLTSIPIAIIAGSKGKSVARDYNEARGYLSVGVTSSGFGLAYNF